MKVFCKEFITVWTRGLVRWLSRKFDSISIDLTPVEEKIDSLDEKISPYLYDECSVDDIERMFSPITENGYIIVPSSIIKQDGTIPLNLFVSITGLTPVLNDDEHPVEPIIDENGRIVIPASAFSSDGTMSISLFQQLTGLRLV